jgi:glucosamine-6-phosphate deaminase
MLLVKLDDNTVTNAVRDGHFPSVEQSPRYAIWMGAKLVFQARKVVLLANGSRKTGPSAESNLGDVSCQIPISYGQKHPAGGGDMVYVLDEPAAADLLARQADVKAKGVHDPRGPRQAVPESGATALHTLPENGHLKLRTLVAAPRR